MTYLGPRPERPELQKEIEKEVPEFGLRLQAKAGLTGYAQVYGNRYGYKLIILQGILGIGKSSLAEKAFTWLYPNKAMSRIIIDFNLIPGIAELAIEMSNKTKKNLISKICEGIMFNTFR